MKSVKYLYMIQTLIKIGKGREKMKGEKKKERNIHIQTDTWKGEEKKRKKINIHIQTDTWNVDREGKQGKRKKKKGEKKKRD